MIVGAEGRLRVNGEAARVLNRQADRQTHTCKKAGKTGTQGSRHFGSRQLNRDEGRCTGKQLGNK